MAKSKTTSLSKARTIQEIGTFWDSHSLVDYWDQTKDVEMTVRAKRRNRVTVDPDVYSQIEEQAHINGVLPETLVNLWLAEKLHRAKRMNRAKAATS
jgi:hypothetical protein